jgi:glycosyltransferase involved in cell wall biosynthesis
MDRLSAILPELASQFEVTFEIIFVDDGSRDGTVAEIKKVCFQYPSRLIVLSRNFGKEVALSAGIDAASGDAVILMDADLQHPPERIGQLLEGWRKNLDVVYFYKSSRRGEGLGRNASARLFYSLINFGTRIEIPADAGDFRLLSRRAVDALKQMPERERFMKGMYAWLGLAQLGIPFEVETHRTDGASRFRPIHMFGLAIDGLTSFSTAPIRLISFAGFVICLISILYLFWIIIERIVLGSPFSGFASIVALVVFFGGMQLVCLGIIGEYVGKALLEAKQRPLYVVTETVEIT